MEELILMTSHFKPSGHNHLQDIRPYLQLYFIVAVTKLPNVAAVIGDFLY